MNVIENGRKILKTDPKQAHLSKKCLSSMQQDNTLYYPSRDGCRWYGLPEWKKLS